MNNNGLNMYRQGDVLIERCEIPNHTQEVKPDAGRAILAYGEVTGHAHAFTAERVSMVTDGRDRYIDVKPGSVLGHEEHTHLPIAPGTYIVGQQCEYNEGEIRRVAD